MTSGLCRVSNIDDFAKRPPGSILYVQMMDGKGTWIYVEKFQVFEEGDVRRGYLTWRTLTFRERLRVWFGRLRDKVRKVHPY
jgi:hypothetical protein